jgi:hypothetical protein
MNETDIENLKEYYTKLNWTSGPDNLCPTESFFSTELEKPVKLRLNELESKKYPPMSIYTGFKRTVHLKPDHPALFFKSKLSDKEYVKMTFLQYWNTCLKASKSFINVIF